MQKNRSINNILITLEMIVYTGFRFMGGEFIKSLEDIFGYIQTTSFGVVGILLNAIDESIHPALSVDILPEIEVENKKNKNEWNLLNKSSFGLLNSQLGVLDGWTACTEMLSNDLNQAGDTV